MCGIFALINNNNDMDVISSEFKKGEKRGPEFSIIKNFDNVLFGFHRLAINGLNNTSNQPIINDDIILICNGEIYNYKSLIKDHSFVMQTQSDCEVIIHMYKLYGIKYTLNLLDGEFAFIIYDKRTNSIIVARDSYGVRPLYYFYENNSFGFGSELKVLYNLVSNKSNIKNFKPGNYLEFENKLTYSYETAMSCLNFISYRNFPCANIHYELNNELYSLIFKKINDAVRKRVIGTAERPIGCLLSGGLDSSLVAALVNKELQNDTSRSPQEKVLNTFSIGLEGSEDLKYAKIVAHHLNSKHHEIVVSEDNFFDAIPEVIKAIESYDTTSVRASVGNYLVAKYINEHSDCKVILNGDGADELMGGYLYMKKAGNKYEFDKECRRLLEDIYMFDVLRSDKSVSSNGLEPRTPFLDCEWVEFYLGITKKLRYETTIQHCEKYLLRKSVEMIDPHLLPSEILWRTKEAFSDGVSTMEKSWFAIIQEKINALNTINPVINNALNETHNFYEKNKTSALNPPKTLEQIYYRYLYNKDYINCDHLIEYFWMPKYVNANDASARTLNLYNEKNTNKV
jgi:asparagine synthase (glutamine-hydrolysing)